ncbi:MAG: glutamine amidotransferase [Candidatus Alcyoniella australis]|nr:glutamine amidotransferase [Candidatus Alcyoniella australis]
MPEDAIRVLYAGDGETINYLVTKGMSFYMAGGYQDESMFLIGALAADPAIEVVHIKPGESLETFPRTIEELSTFDVCLLSDIGADTILFYMDRDKVPMGPDRIKLLERWCRQGGGLGMIGGWSSFGGWGGQARWHDTPVERCLPVLIKDGDDRVETVEGIEPQPIDMQHPIIAGLPWDWSEQILYLGYNRFRAKPEARVLAKVGDDPLLVVGQCDQGRSLAYASDCAPHWAGSMLKWPGNPQFWVRCVRWLAGRL